MYGYIAHPQTILSGIHKLPPAHRAVWHDGRMSIGSYWRPDWNQEDSRPEAENAERLRELLADAVREQMISDVPLGAFLSGGIDSTVIAGLMKEAAASGPIKTFTIGFDDPAFDESRFAELAANHLKTEHQTFVVEPRAWETLPALSDQFDEPFADSSALPTWYVSKYTREHVTVALTGDAGDELFGGYDRYRALALGESAERLPRPLRSLLAGPVASRFPASVRAKTRGRRIRRWLESLADPAPVRYLRWMTYFDEPARMSLYDDDFIEQLSHETSTDAFGGDPATLLQRAWNLASRRDSVTRAMVADLSLYLPCDLLVKVDLASMAHSLECRGPFLDHRVVEFAMSLPIDQKLHPVRGESKRILKRACADMLPPEIAHRPKMGFGVPIDRWFRGELRNELREVLLDPRTLARGFFRRGETERLIAEHAEGRMDHAYRLWSLLMLELWFRHHMDQAPPSSDRTDSRSHSPTTIAATPQPAHEPS
jgi:asparagine synthase (glutamine-hydrolysing)